MCGEARVRDLCGIAPELRRIARLDLLRLKVLVLDVRRHRLDDLRRDVVLVEVEHRVQEPLGVGEHLLARLPVIGHLLAGGAHHLRRHRLEHAHRLHHQLDARRRVGVLCHLRQVRELEVAQHGDGGVERRERLRQIALGRVFDLLALLRLGRRDGLLLDDDGAGLVGLGLVLFNLLHHHLDLLRRLDQHGLHLLELRLQLVDLDLGRLELVEPDHEPLLRRRHLLALHHQQPLERAEQLEVRGGRHVGEAPLRLLVLAARHLDRLVDLAAHVHDPRLRLVRS